jgi:hypothetical protein
MLTASSTATSGPQRSTFRSKLTPQQRAAFDELARKLASPGADLGRYHAIGGLVDQLLPADVARRGRVVWLRELAGTLGCSHTLLQESLTFAEQYSGAEYVAALQKLSVKWTLVYIAFPVHDKEACHQLLAEAADKHWTPEQMRFEVQRRHTVKRHGVGGRLGASLSGRPRLRRRPGQPGGGATAEPTAPPCLGR